MIRFVEALQEYSFKLDLYSRISITPTKLDHMGVIISQKPIQGIAQYSYAFRNKASGKENLNSLSYINSRDKINWPVSPFGSISIIRKEVENHNYINKAVSKKKPLKRIFKLHK